MGLPIKNEFTAKELLDYIESDNMLAEVEGKNTFIKKIIHNFYSFENNLFFYVPIKSKSSPIWIYIRLSRIQKNKNLILGQVIRIYDDVPREIIHYQKTYQDLLTKLFTRETLKMHFEYINNIKKSYFIYFDIDGFKRINDKYGHQMGDQFLIDLSKFFFSQWEYNVIYYRLDGDEFAMYCYDHSKEDIIKRMEKIISDIGNLSDISRELKISASFGIVKITENNKDYHNLLNLGDKTMYESKNKGPGKYTFCNK